MLRGDRAERRANLLWILAAVAITIPVVGLAMIDVKMSIIVVGVLIAAVTLPHMRLYVALAALMLPLSPVAIISGPGLVFPVGDVMALVGILSFCLARRNRPLMPGTGTPWGSILGAILPGLALIAPYPLFALYNGAANNLGQNTTVVIQRTEIVVLWLLFGAAVWRAGMIRTFLKWFVVSTSALSLAWIATPGTASVFGMQKNSCGGYIATGVLIVLLSGLKGKYRLPLLALLAAGLISTGSRGSITGLAVATAILIVYKSQWKRVVLPLAATCGLGFGILYLLPEEVQARLLSQNEAGQFNIDIRGLFMRDALAQWEPYPWTGIGVGNYRQRSPGLQQVQTYDPHNVYVLALTEGGYILAGAFILMVAGTLFWILRKRTTNLTILAITIQVAIMAHSYVDVYWVRGTPSAGWFLLGAAAMAAYAARKNPSLEEAKPITRDAAASPRVPRPYERLATRGNAIR